MAGKIRLYHIQATTLQDSPLTTFASTMQSSSVVPLVATRNKVNKNINYRVVTYDVEAAIKLLKDKYPDAEITNISLKEKIDDVDLQIVLEIFNSTKLPDSE